MTGKKWFYWLGIMDGKRKSIWVVVPSTYPRWVIDAYNKGWHVGYNEVSG